ncbi:protein kinase [Stylonychia lemnae]|uniref:Protein kinase n=1 Tax=Stylonychia lemnae TaxID=5949 RepID=A0A077ZZQ6_STYLE|nr:protein kinase [Stylonychia lemnae]|eukprot:CDW75370.1 protein kinase [Stylonychia lemnae]
MDKYKIIKQLGEGTFGKVVKAVNTETNELVAIKKLKSNYNWEDAIAMSEIKSLRKLNSHPNVIKIIEMIRKKEEILINLQLKLADFGTARELDQSGKFTDYVGTRWYRAPELLLRSSNYTQAVDVFGLGCIFIELYLGRPIFVGQNESDQLFKIFSVMGTPNQQQWPEGYRLADQMGLKFQQMTQTPLIQLFQREISDEAIDLMNGMLRYESSQRFTAIQCLNHSYFKDVQQYIQMGGAAGNQRQYQSGQRMPLVKQQLSNQNQQQQQQQQSYGGSNQPITNQQNFTKQKSIKGESNSQPTFKSSQAQDDLNSSSMYQPTITDSKRMSKYGAFSFNTNISQPNLPSQSKQNIDDSFSQLNDSSYNPMGVQSKPFTKPLIGGSSIQNKNYNYQYNQFQNNSPNPVSNFQTPQRELNQNRKFSQLGSSLIQGNITNNYQSLVGTSTLDGLGNSFSTQIPKESMISKTFGPNDILAKELQKQDENNMYKTDINQGQRQIGGAQGSGAYNNRLTNNQRRAFIPDYASSGSQIMQGSFKQSNVNDRQQSNNNSGNTTQNNYNNAFNIYGSTNSDLSNVTNIGVLNDRQSTANDIRGNASRLAMNQGVNSGGGSVFSGIASRQIMGGLNNNLSDMGGNIPTFGRHQI